MFRLSPKQAVMLNALINWSLHNRLLVILGTLGFAVLGVFSLRSLPIDAFPDTTPVQVQISTMVPGLAAEEVERQITFPVEQALSGLPRLTQLRSTSRFGLSQAVVTFEDGTDIYFARQQVAERLGGIEMPDVNAKPRMGPVATGLGEVFHYMVTRKDGNLTEARTIQDWIVRPALRTTPGVAEVNSWGGNEKQYQVRVDPDLLVRYGVTLDEVTQAIRASNYNVGGGNISQAGEMLLVQGIGRTSTLPQLRDIVVTARKSVPVRIGDVAVVQTGSAQRTGAVTADGKGEVVLGLGFMLMGENSHTVTYRLKEKLDEVTQTLPPGTEVKTFYDRTELVNHVIDTVRKNLFEGGLLVIAVLFIFLGNLRAGLIVAAAIPFSMLFAFCGMARFGIAGSLLSLGALDFGLVVDSSVVMIENVMRHLAHDDKGERSRLEAVRDAAIEVRKPTMFGELIIMIVYLPILTLEGVEGKLFRPMALTVIFALFGSLVLSLTLMPVLAGLFLPRKVQEKDPWIVRLARWFYAPALRFAMHHRVAVVGLALIVLGGAAMIARSLGSEFIPRLSEGALVVGVTRLAGTDLDEVIRLNTEMERALLKEFPNEVEHVWSRCGTGEVATDPMGVESTDFFIALKPRDQWSPRFKSQDDLREEMEKALAFIPGQNLNFSQPIEQRVNEMISGVRGDVAVKIFGDDLQILTTKGAEVGEALRSVQGCDSVSIEQLTGQPVLQVRVKQDQLARFGLQSKAVLEVVESLVGKPLGDVTEGQMRFPLVARLPEKLRRDPDAIGALLISTPSGERLPLSRLAAVELVEGPSTINREWGQRRIVVQCNIQDRDVGSFVAEAQAKVKEKVQLPAGRYRIEWGGQFEQLESAKQRLTLVVPVALILILGLLYFTYHQLRDALLVFTAVPFASVGGILALWLRDLPFSISAGVGFIALSGVSVLNSMVLVTFIRQLREGGMERDEATREAALTRLRPVLMTALVASLGFVPMAFSAGMGAEVQRPLATVVIGGVLSSTLLTLLVLPSLYSLLGGPVVVNAPEKTAAKPEQGANGTPRELVSEAETPVGV